MQINHQDLTVAPIYPKGKNTSHKTKTHGETQTELEGVLAYQLYIYYFPWENITFWWCSIIFRLLITFYHDSFTCMFIVAEFQQSTILFLFLSSSISHIFDFRFNSSFSPLSFKKLRFWPPKKKNYKTAP